MTLDGARTLVTGADGFIGSHLVEALVATGADVTALSCYNSFDRFGWLDDLTPDVLAKIRRVRGDIRDPAQVRHLVRDQEIVFHLAALIAIPHSYVAPHSYVETNVMGTLNLLEAVREFDVRRMVHTSTSEVYGTAMSTPIAETHMLQGQSPYAASKIGADMMAEAYARSFDVPVVVLRPFNTFGPRQSERAIIPTIVRQALDESCSAIRIGAGAPKRDLTYVYDTVRAFIALAAMPNVEFGRPYNAGSGKSSSIAVLADLIREIIGSEKPLVHDPERMRPSNSEVGALIADSGRLANHTGWSAKTPLRTGLKSTIEWWRRRLTSGLVRREHDYIT
jgi:NAD dependent epimerase/dehydratase